ncbi:MAG: hypothetical protein ABSB01_21045, partial [Streptosporangiaceae bacterium]
MTGRAARGPVARGSVLRVAGYRFRATFRRRWGGYLTLALLIGLVGGVSMGSLTAARRTYASYPKFLASTNPSDLLVLPSLNGPDPSLVHELARLPHVRSAEAGEQLTAATLTPRGGVGTVLITQVELIASPDGLFTDQDRLKIIEGRAANPARADEVVATNEAASVLGLHVGSRIPVGILPDNAEGPKFVSRTELTVVGIGVLGIQLVHDDIDSDRAGFLVG